MFKLIFWLTCMLQFVDLWLINTLPPVLKQCRNDDALNVCLADAIQSALPVLQYGLPVLNVPALDPLYIDYINIEGEDLILNLNNTSCEGLASAIVTDVEASLGEDEMQIGIKVQVSKLDLYGDYDIDGILAGKSAHGEGKYSLNFGTVNGTLIFYGKKIKKLFQTYMRIAEVHVEYTTDKAILQLDNVFDGNSELTEEFNEHLRTNWQEVHNEIQPTYTEGLVPVYQQYANSIFEQVPYGEIFLDKLNILLSILSK